MSNAAAAATPAPRGKLIPVVIVLVVLGGAGGGFWFWRQSSASAAGHEPAPKKETKAAVLALEPFLVNLADTQASRFLRVTVRLLVADESGGEIEHGSPDMGTPRWARQARRLGQEPPGLLRLPS